MNYHGVDLDYTIEVMSNTDESVKFNLYNNDEDNKTKVDLKDNKTSKISLPRNSKQDHNYRLEVIYDNTKSLSASDILENIQVKVHSEQSKI